jgi:Phosphodiester glycosidase
LKICQSLLQWTIKSKSEKNFMLSLSFSLGVLLFLISHILAPSIPTTAVETIRYQTHNLPSGKVHTLFIPAQSHAVTLAVSPQLDTLENFAKKYGAIAVLNAGFFDPINHKTTSYITQQGKLIADPRLNERLVNNPDLIPHMARILNRSEFRRYLCGKEWRYDIALHNEAMPKNCTLIDAVGGGPRLLPELTAQQEAFITTDPRQGSRDALGSRQPNARTAVGITRDGNIIWVMAAQKPNTTPSGMSLPELAKFMQTLGVEAAMNLDGGSSSALYYQGKTFSGKLDSHGKQIQRPVKSVLLVKNK